MLETARGGILLRGIGVRHNDVAVVTNVSADHLGLHGIDTVDQLAEVKATITRITRPDGWDVLNADDPRVLAMRRHAIGRIWVWSLDPEHPAIRETLAEHGRATTVIDGRISWLEGQQLHPLLATADVPVTIAGLSSIFTANALAAASAALAVGLPASTRRPWPAVVRPRPGAQPGPREPLLPGPPDRGDRLRAQRSRHARADRETPHRAPAEERRRLAVDLHGGRPDRRDHARVRRPGRVDPTTSVSPTCCTTRAGGPPSRSTTTWRRRPRRPGCRTRRPGTAASCTHSSRCSRLAPRRRDRGHRARYVAAAVPLAGRARWTTAHAGRRAAPGAGRGPLTRVRPAPRPGRRRAAGRGCRPGTPGSIDRSPPAS